MSRGPRGGIELAGLGGLHERGPHDGEVLEQLERRALLRRGAVIERGPVHLAGQMQQDADLVLQGGDELGLGQDHVTPRWAGSQRGQDITVPEFAASRLRRGSLRDGSPLRHEAVRVVTRLVARANPRANLGVQVSEAWPIASGYPRFAAGDPLGIIAPVCIPLQQE